MGALAPAPSLDPSARAEVLVAGAAPPSATAIGVAVAASGVVPEALGLARDHLETAGFDGSVGSALVLPAAEGPLLVAVGVGEPTALDVDRLRDAAAAFARAVPKHTALATDLADVQEVAAAPAAHAVTEGVLLARYSYDALRTEATSTPVAELTLVAGGKRRAGARTGAHRGRVFAETKRLARDLANTPHSHLNATRLGELAVALGKEHGFAVQVFDKAALEKLGCGGLLAVNQGSAEPPCMIKLTYTPERRPSGRLALAGKGVMYDSGGLSLKPSDAVHAQMKNDMSGAGAVLALFAALRELRCRAAVTGYLMCTDNMPSGTAMALGDVITIYGGTTVEVEDTDAEGRLIMADALALAAEEKPDAIVDIATLTGSALRALGPWVAALLGTSQPLVDQVRTAAEVTGEHVWQMPLYERYRSRLDSGVADLKNVAPLGWPDNIMASLFLASFVDDVPWAHVDICGPAQNDADRPWQPTGCSGFGARLLLQTVLGFKRP